MDLPDWDLNTGVRRGEKIPDSHLQSPIRPDNRLYLAGARSKVPRFLQDDVASCPVDKKYLEKDSENVIGYLMAAALSYRGPVDGWTVEHYTESLEVIQEQVRILCSDLNIVMEDQPYAWTESDHKLMGSKRMWDNLRFTMRDMKISRKTGWISYSSKLPGARAIYLSQNYCLVSISKRNDTWYILDYDQVMMINDTINSRSLSIICNRMLPEKSPGRIPLGLMEELYNILDLLLVEKGNEAYREIGLWEPCCLAIMLKQHDRLKSAETYYDWFNTEVSSNSYYAISRIRDILLEARLTMPQLAELHGLYRHWGHPTVDEALGCEKVRSIGTSRPDPVEETVMQATGALKRQFIASFITKRGRWPRVYLPEGYEGCAISKLIQEQPKVINFYSPEYPLEHWAAIRFGQEFDFDYHDDFTSLIEDRSISCYRSDLRTIYNAAALGYKVKASKSYRRLLQEILNRPEICIKSICEKIMRGDVPKEWKIVLIHAKERELKIEPRLFAMMPMEMRLYFCVTESNIGHNIFPYFPQQTMTLDEAELHKRLYYLSRALNIPKEFLPSTAGLDFSSWNLTWVELATRLIFQMIDDLHGTPNLFSYTHKFFSDSLIALASNLNPPQSVMFCKAGDPPECNELWYHHQSGFEGLRQKGWTLCTIALLLLVEQKTGIKSYIVGQGDNQVCRLMIPVPSGYDGPDSYLQTNQSEVTRILKKFMSILTQLASDLGLVIKPQETSMSSDVLVYGKEILYRGAYMTQGLKRISRTLPDTNETFSTLHTQVSTLQTAGFSCSQKTVDIIVPYIIGAVESLVCTMDSFRRLYQKKAIRPTDLGQLTSKKFKRFLTYLTSETAGYPFLSFYHMLYRGCPDPLATSMTTLYQLAHRDELAQKLYRWLQAGLFKTGQGSPELLVSNPKSLNLKVPLTVSSRLRGRLEKTLTRGVKNHCLKQIFTTKRMAEDRQMYSYLIKTEPLAPRVLHEVFRNSEAGSRLSFFTKFHNTKTIQDIFSRDDENQSFLDEIVGLETEAARFWVDMYDEVTALKTETSADLMDPTLLCQYLRETSWGQVIDYRKIEGVTIPHPAHQFKCHPIWEDDIDSGCSCGEYILFTTNKQMTPQKLVERGPYQAYVGSQTREKLTGKLYQLPVVSRPLMAAFRLEQVRGWTIHPHSKLNTTIDNLIKNRTNVPPSVLSLTGSAIAGGSVTHRLDDHVTKRSTLNNSRANHTTHIWFSCDHMGRMSRGSDNYNIHFQGAIHLGHTWYLLNTMYSARIPIALKVCYSCTKCEEKLEDARLTNEHKPPTLSASTGNPLLYTRLESIDLSVASEGKHLITKVRARAEDAIACILFSRLIGHMNSFLIGVTEVVSPSVSVVGVTEIIGAGIEKILKSLAVYLYLYLPRDLSDAEEVAANIHPKMLADLASVCLLPEVLEQLTGISTYAPSAEIFTSRDMMCYVLKRIIDGYLNDLDTGSDCTPEGILRHPFFPSTHIGQYKIVSMWSKQVWIATRGLVDIHELASQADYSPSKTHQDFIDPVFMSSLSKLILTRYGESVYFSICDLMPLRYSDVPQEIVARESRSKIPRPRGPLTSPLKITVESGPFFLIAECHDLSGLILVDQWEDEPPREPKPITQKSRVDQRYRLHGNISTSFYKVLEIVAQLHLPTEGPALTLAEGEGSIAWMLYRLGCSPIYYNSLFPKDDMASQRASSIVPAYMAPAASQVRWGEELAITGGDLTDPKTLALLLQKAPVSACCVTCDAESAIPDDHIKSLRIMLAWCCFMVKTSAQWGLFKTFCVSDQHVVNMIGMMMLVCDQVDIITPHFSSNEGTEVYLLARKTRVKCQLDTLITHHAEGRPLVSSGGQMYHPIIKTYRRVRIVSHPLQSSLGDRLLELWRAAEDLGFPDNSVSCAERMTLHCIPYNGEPFREWLKKCREKAIFRASKSCGVQTITYYGLEQQLVPPALIQKHYKLSTQLERYMLICVNCKLLSAVFTQCTLQNDAIIDIITQPYKLEISGQVVYTYQVNCTE